MAIGLPWLGGSRQAGSAHRTAWLLAWFFLVATAIGRPACLAPAGPPAQGNREDGPIRTGSGLDAAPPPTECGAAPLCPLLGGKKKKKKKKIATGEVLATNPPQLATSYLLPRVGFFQPRNAGLSLRVGLGRVPGMCPSGELEAEGGGNAVAANGYRIPLADHVRQRQGCWRFQGAREPPSGRASTSTST